LDEAFVISGEPAHAPFSAQNGDQYNSNRANCYQIFGSAGLRPLKGGIERRI